MTALADAPAYPAGVYDIPEDDYFAQTWALSCSGCKLLLPPSCPAKFFWRQDHPEHKAVWDFGSGAHKLVLGNGPEIVEVAAGNWMTNAAKQQRDEARAAGKIPLLSKELRQCQAMAAALEEHELAWNVLDPEHGHAEQSVFWTDERTGTPLRARLDWQYDAGAGRIVIADYKTVESADPDKFSKSCADYGYHMQDAMYTDGLKAVTGADVAFWFIAQEKAPPYLVNVIELAPDSVRIGRVRVARAIDTYRACIATGDWPGYGQGLTEITLPAWASRDEDYS